ncbi:MAG: 16S rRNA (adenine(1518)-N(6)/adenine(1519)-N(6))-dimethyltransferase RsmA [Treponema sp.]|jgi:16S rRNA (adenine1518-N6/adenine1519-N6)-dimethyltransferase|nr:16S rRNA (adenine(1518)-N(6)/adenine(1519)-N(6))-dimethyltransferase RsmA [Treponema sp.]
MNLNYNAPSSIRAFLENRGLSPLKKYGQHFLIDPAARERLLDALACPAGGLVWEVGPGLGAQTAGLLARGARVRAFEIDRAFSSILIEFFGSNRDFCLVQGDVLQTWPAAAAQDRDGPPPFFMGNLPYNIAGTLLGGLIEGGMLFTRMAVTVQKETAERLRARPGTSAYSSLSVLCAACYKVKPLCALGGAAFYPPPRVESQALLLSLREDRPALPPLFQPLVRALFGARRKTIRNNLDAWLGARAAADALAAAGLDGSLRAERLSEEDFLRLAGALCK